MNRQAIVTLKPIKKMKQLCLLFLVLSFVSCGKKELPFGQYQEVISLNGTWHFLASNEIGKDQLLTADYSSWDTLNVPGNWDTRDRYADFVGKGYYSKEFNIPEDWTDKHVRVHFGAVYQTAKVWLNGQFLGEHVGGYTPFGFNVTDVIDRDGNNSLVVMADNSYNRGAWWPWGGISREVSLEAHEPIRLVSQHISAIPDFERDEVQFAIRYKLENNSSKTVTADIRTTIDQQQDTVYATKDVAPGEEVFSEIKFNRSLADYQLWGIDAPNLYSLTSQVTVDGKTVDLDTDKFGIRKFEVREEQFFLNNKPVRLNGVNRVHDHPAYGNTEPDPLVRKDMMDIKYNLGGDFARLMHAPYSEDLLDLCDSIGFLLVGEIPVWGDDDPQAFPDNPLTKHWLKEMVERDYNHPSIVAWSVGNELRDPKGEWSEKSMTTAQYKYVNSMLDYVEKLDASRLKTYVTITSYRQGEVGTEPYEKVDFISMNSYGEAVKLAQKTHEKFPGKPIFISEIGKSQIGPAPAAELSEELVTELKGLKDLPYVTGFSIWSYNDYRSKYKGTPASGFREWGVVNERRERKKAYGQLKEVFSFWEK
ncbi:glycoside hydrolase family 2 protein [Echinicola strongylocentroti]|nr:glycoside hydrolase family 2 TIM barrel-domain containing protein [Echinicola strongylocentroti]